MKKLRYRFLLTIGKIPWGCFYLTRDGLGLLKMDLDAGSDFIGTEAQALAEGQRRLEARRELYPEFATDTVTLEEVGTP